MSNMYGMFIAMNDDGSTTTNKVKRYASYQEMIADDNPGNYGIVDNAVYHKNGTDWVIGFPNVVKENDYTAFEVFAHDYEIPVGECADLGGYVNNAITASLTHKFQIRSAVNVDDQDVIVDWGDGAITELSKITPSGTPGSYRYTVEHTYSNNGKYVVRIFGKNYFALINGENNNPPTPVSWNLMCRVLDYDLPVASHLVNFSSFCLNSQHLLYVDVSRTQFNVQANNVANMFLNCKNLIECTGFSSRTNRFTSINGIFRFCSSLTNTDIKLPISGIEYGCVTYPFDGCTSLTIDISSLFFNTYFEKSSVARTSWFMFRKCSKLTGTVPADKLWDDPNVLWDLTHKPFEGCSDEIRAQVPVSWGGTASDDIIKK